MKFKPLLIGLLAAVLFGLLYLVVFAQGPEPAPVFSQTTIVWVVPEPGGVDTVAELEGDISNVQLSLNVKLVCAGQVYTQSSIFDVDMASVAELGTGDYMTLEWPWTIRVAETQTCQEYTRVAWRWQAERVYRLYGEDWQIFEPREIVIATEGVEGDDDGYYYNTDITLIKSVSVLFPLWRR